LLSYFSCNEVAPFFSIFFLSFRCVKNSRRTLLTRDTLLIVM
jgi:hypothetical protein